MPVTLKFTPADIARLQADPRLRGLPHGTLMQCCRAIEGAAAAAGCACQEDDCLSYDHVTHHVLLHGHPVLRCAWLPEAHRDRAPGEPTGPLKITRLHPFHS